MLSFLTQDYKTMIRREYILRFLTVVFFVLIVLAIVAGLLLIPYLTFVGSQEAISASRFALLTDSSQVRDSQTFRIELSNLRAEALRLTPSAKVLPYELINELSALFTNGVELSSIEYTLNKDGTAAISLSGVASTRLSLQSFISTLQNVPGLTGVSIPVSAFAQDKNIGFNLSINAMSLSTQQ